MTALSVELVASDHGTALVLSGELDLSTVDLAEDALYRIENESRERVTIDLSRLDFIDSTGLRFVLSAHERAVRGGRPFAIVRGPDPVHRVFLLTRLDERLPFAGGPTRDHGAGDTA